MVDRERACGGPSCWCSRPSDAGIIAVSGVVLLGFVLGHMLGNLQIYLGAQSLNDYAETLKHSPILLWGTRAGAARGRSWCTSGSPSRSRAATPTRGPTTT